MTKFYLPTHQYLIANMCPILLSIGSITIEENIVIPYMVYHCLKI